MNKKKPHIDKTYFILLVTVTLVTYLIYILVFPVLKPPDKPIQDTDIVYLEITDTNSYIKFINADGSGMSTRDVIFSVPRFIKILGVKIPIAYHDIENQVSTVSWSPDREMLAFTYPNRNVLTYFFPDIDIPYRYPGIITTEGKILTCPQDDSMYTYYIFPVQLLDQERIVINVGSPFNDTNYLAVYNVRECKQESVYFDGSNERGFAISSKGWLAVFEGINGQYYINIYDDQQNLVDYLLPLEPVDWMEWSKDGNQLLYRNTWDYKYTMVNNHDFQTGKKSTLSKDAIWASYSPDDKKIVFERDGQLFILDNKTRKEVFLADGMYPQWRP